MSDEIETENSLMKLHCTLDDKDVDFLMSVLENVKEDLHDLNRTKDLYASYLHKDQGNFTDKLRIADALHYLNLITRRLIMMRKFGKINYVKVD